jgi:hypothetical protein
MPVMAKLHHIQYGSSEQRIPVIDFPFPLSLVPVIEVIVKSAWLRYQFENPLQFAVNLEINNVLDTQYNVTSEYTLICPFQQNNQLEVT